MVEFCPECENMLRKKLMDGKPSLACRCGYHQDIVPNDVEVQNNIQKKNDALKNNLIVVSEDDKISIHPIVSKDCPKCKNDKVEAWQEQTRSADEPSTSFFRCTKCKHTFREY
jgi:DNA-directed RNA polymerase subunit M